MARKFTYDVVFNNDTDGNCMGFHSSRQYCYDWVQMNKRDKSTYFGDYVGGVVEIVRSDGKVVYERNIK